MKYTLGLFLALAVSLPGGADVWQDVSPEAAQTSPSNMATRVQVPNLNRARQLKFETNSLQFKLNQAPLENAGVSNATLDLPLPNGGFVTFAIYNSPIMEPGLALKNTDIQTFKAVDISNPENIGRLDMTPAGFHAMFDYEGRTVFIDPVGTAGQYQSYFKTDYASEMSGQNRSPIICTADHFNRKKEQNQTGVQRAQNQTSFANDVSFGTEVRTYRFAVAATGEFTAFHGGTKASSLAAIVTGLNRVNQVFERDMAIKLELVANNSDIIYTDAASDPYTDDDTDALISETKADLDGKIGVANYDIGHVFSTGGGGLAGLGVVCGSSKSEGVTGSPQPINDFFFIDFVAHEIGHQFSAEHTFNGSASGCAGNRSETAAYEPGSGSTIMGYASICGEEDIQSAADAYFHNHSIAQAREFVSNVARGGSCGVSSTLSNAVPTVNAGGDGNIPRSTPFMLTGSATDADAGDSLTYRWEQYDLGAMTSSKATLVDDGSRPLFRTFSPVASATRIFPQISNVLSGTVTYGEILPTTARDLNLRLTVRDQKGGVASDTRKLTVSDTAGPFTVTPASTDWTGGGTQVINWDVANTTAAPINCSDVDVSFSSDGGQSFPTQFFPASTGTPNDGAQSVTVPAAATTTGRVQVSCRNQPFFALNSTNITISGMTTLTPNTAPIAVADSFTVAQDSGATGFSVLSNDSDSDGDTLTVSGVSSFSNGGSAAIGGAVVNYTPAAGFSGTETFDYAISDGNGGTSTAAVTVTVTATPPNTAPTAAADSLTVDENSAATLIAVLSNDSDSDGDTLSITAVSAPSGGGTATVSGNDISYQPATGFSGSESFTYDISDGNSGTASATVTVTVTAAPVVTPPPTPTPPVSSGGGGSIGLFLLLLLGLGGIMKAPRFRRSFIHNGTE